MRRYLPVTKTRLETDDTDSMMWDAKVEYNPVLKLDSDRGEAMRKMQRIQTISKCFPQIDCGSCGAPTCAALAEDIVRGEANEDDCVIEMRRQIHAIYDHLGKMVHDTYHPSEKED